MKTYSNYNGYDSLITAINTKTGTSGIKNMNELVSLIESISSGGHHGPVSVIFQHGSSIVNVEILNTQGISGTIDWGDGTTTDYDNTTIRIQHMYSIESSPVETTIAITDFYGFTFKTFSLDQGDSDNYIKGINIDCDIIMNPGFEFLQNNLNGSSLKYRATVSISDTVTEISESFISLSGIDGSQQSPYTIVMTNNNGIIRIGRNTFEYPYSTGTDGNIYFNNVFCVNNLNLKFNSSCKLFFNNLKLIEGQIISELYTGSSYSIDIYFGNNTAPELLGQPWQTIAAYRQRIRIHCPSGTLSSYNDRFSMYSDDIVDDYVI